MPRNAQAAAYAELHCLSNYTFLRGASFPEELVARAHALGYTALAITDECSLSGVVRAHQAAQRLGLHLIIGSELRFDDGLQLILLACNRAGYGQLCRLITHARRSADKGDYRLQRADLNDALADCLALLPVTEQTTDDDAAWLTKVFSGHAWLALELLRDGSDDKRLQHSAGLAARHGLPRVASGDVHMHVRGRRALQDLLTAVRHNIPLSQLGHAALSNGERHLRSRGDLAALYPPQLLVETLRLAARCTFSLDEVCYQYPDDVTPRGMSAHAWLRQLTEQGISRRWPRGCPEKVRTQVEHELALIAELGYEAYFLTVWDMVRFARERGILCQGRGSAANSAVCYCLGITEVDPARMNLLFERFISRERNEPPDIDVDFEHQRREEVIQYVYQKYGRERAALAATVICYRTRSALRDVGKALGLGLEQVEALVAAVAAWRRHGEIEAKHLAEAGFDPANPTLQRLRILVNLLRGFPRHLSQHVGGFVIAAGRLDELVPIENASMPERTVIQWEKDDLEALGLLKVDVLALGMLSAIRRALDLLNGYWVKRDAENAEERRGHGVFDAGGMRDQGEVGSASGAAAGVGQAVPAVSGIARPARAGHGDAEGAEERRGHRVFADGVTRDRGEVGSASNTATGVGHAPSASKENHPLTLQDIPAEDPAVYQMIQQADTIGVFQIESRAQMSMLPRLKPACFYDLVIEVAIVRPGPIQGDMVHPYLRRRQGSEAVEYPSDEVRGVLERTLGVPIFQEQVIKLAMVAAGFTPGEADHLRRAMAAWKRRGGLEPYQQRLMEGMQARGYRREFAERVYRQILGFGDYGFPESHAASFALLVYVSAWLKHYHPAAFCAALLNSQPMGFYAPAQLVRDAREHGVEVLPADVGCSDWDCTLEVFKDGQGDAKDAEKRRDRKGIESQARCNDQRAKGATDRDPGSPKESLRSLRSFAHSASQDSARIGAQAFPGGTWKFPDVGQRDAKDAEERRGRKGIESQARCNDQRADGPTDRDPDSPEESLRSLRSFANSASKDRVRSGQQNGSPALRLGLCMVRGLSAAAAQRIVGARRTAAFSDVQDLARRAQLNRADLKALAAADALRGLAGHRHLAAWQVAGVEEALPIATLDHFAEQLPLLMPPTAGQTVLADYAQIGLSLHEHPLALIREHLHARGLLSSAEVAERAPGDIVRAAGLVLIRQRPGNGRAIFVTLEDECGGLNLLIWANLAERQRKILLGAQLLGVVAEIQRAEGVQHLLCRRLEDHSDLLGELNIVSRDFH